MSEFACSLPISVRFRGRKAKRKRVLFAVRFLPRVATGKNDEKWSWVSLSFGFTSGIKGFYLAKYRFFERLGA